MKVRTLTLLAVMALAGTACRGARIRPAEPRVPEPNPCVTPPVVVARGPAPRAPDYCPPPTPVAMPMSVEIDERVSPAVDCNPVRTQHTIVVTVRDANGNPMPGQRVEWILARHSEAVGDIVAVDDQYATGLSTVRGGGATGGGKFDNQYGVSVTNFEEEAIDAANNFPFVDAVTGARLPDIRIGRGQSWITITSVHEGVTDVVAYVPGIKDGSRHKAFAKKIWADYDVTYPPEAVNLLPQATHAFTVNVHKASDGSGLAGQAVEAEVLDGPAATFESSGSNRTTVTTGGDGNATFTLRNTGGAGVNRVRFTTRGRFYGQECPRSVVVRKTWQQVVLACQCALSTNQCDMDQPLEATVTLMNTGDAPATDVQLQFSAPAGLAPADGTTFPVLVGTVAPGATVQKTFRFQAVATGTHAVQWTATSSTGAATSSCGCSVEIVQGAFDVSCVCMPATVSVGQPFQVEVRVANTGRGTLRNVGVNLVWPEGVTPLTQNTAVIGDIPAGVANPEKLVFQARADRTGELTSRVRATADGIAGEATATCAVRVVQCALSMSLIAPGRMGFAEPGNFTAKIVNEGDGPAEGCVLRITNGTCLDQPTIEVPIGTLAPGQTFAHDWVATGKANGTCTVAAEITCSGCTQRQEAQVEVAGLPAIQTEMIDQDVNHRDVGRFKVGEEFLYALTVLNDAGTDSTPPLRVAFALPNDMEVVSATSSRADVSITTAGRNATSTDFRLDVDERLVIEFRVRATSLPPGNWVRATAQILRASDGASLAEETESTTIEK